MSHSLRSAVSALTVVAIAGLGLAACGDDGAPSVDVVLGEFVVEPDPTSEDAGEIEFVADNQGAETHELVIVQAASAEALPTDEDGAVDEAQLPEGALIDEIEDIESQTSQSVTVDLEAGSYVLFCNVTEEEDGVVESHFEEGMHAGFTVS
jgi:hypothetical protein